MESAILIVWDKGLFTIEPLRQYLPLMKGTLSHQFAFCNSILGVGGSEGVLPLMTHSKKNRTSLGEGFTSQVKVQPLPQPLTSSPNQSTQNISPVSLPRPLLPTNEADVEKYFDQLNEWFSEELPTDYDQAREWIWVNCNSYEKMHALMYLHGELDFSEWLKLLGEFWQSCDNIGVYAGDLLWIIREWLDEPHSTIPELMDNDDPAAYDALPDQITIFRGCGPLNKGGHSWSLDRDVAARFPFLARYATDSPMLLTATISKCRAAAMKVGAGSKRSSSLAFLNPLGRSKRSPSVLLVRLHQATTMKSQQAAPMRRVNLSDMISDRFAV